MQSGTTMIVQERPWYNYPEQQHQTDERDGFLMWLRGEFAAANAIIDALCHHMQVVGAPGEYDGVIGCIQQRRCNWNPILHMQHYFSVAEVIYALQQVGWRRQQRAVGFEGGARMEGSGKEYKREGRGHGGGVEVQHLGGGVNVKNSSNVYVESKFNVNGKLDGGEKSKVLEKRGEEENQEMNQKSEADSLTNRLGRTEEVLHAKEKAQVAGEGSCNLDNSGVVLHVKRNNEVSPTTFVATEICDGKPVNVVDGMKLYKEIFDDSEISNLTTLVNDLRAAGRRGHLQGQSFVLSKRPMKGHGRETIQLGVPIADASAEDETSAGIPKDWRMEPIPALLQYAIERLLTEQVVSIKPDSCIIDIFNEGDHSQPYIWPQSFGRPVCMLFLTECEMSFGKVMAVDHPGHYRGALKLSLSPGSILVMQGRSADFARHAVHSARKQRVIVTLTKSKPKRINLGDVRHFPSVAAPPSHWVPSPGRSSSHIRPMAAKHYCTVPPSGVLSTLTSHQQIPQPNGIQPIFVSAPVAPAVAFPAPVALPPASAGWTAGPPWHPPPLLPVPGTGVFLPSQSSSNSSNQLASTLETEHITLETSVESEKDDGLGKSNGINTLQNIDSQVPQQECNGGIGGTNVEIVIRKEELHETLDSSKSEKAI